MIWRKLAALCQRLAAFWRTMTVFCQKDGIVLATYPRSWWRKMDRCHYLDVSMDCLGRIWSESIISALSVCGGWGGGWGGGRGYM